MNALRRTVQQFGTTRFLAKFKPNGHRFAERNIVWQGFQNFLANAGRN
jgi:hypothetical protein